MPEKPVANGALSNIDVSKKSREGNFSRKCQIE
jgi:hypothetical protein